MANESVQASGFVKRKILQMCESHNGSEAKAMLAKLRRGIGRAPGSMPELWKVTLEGLTETLISKNKGPTRVEWAVHTALTLYALHQQGKDLKGQCMNREGESLGIAVRKLIQNEEDEQRIKRRFDSAATSESIEEFSHHLRGLIQLLKAKDIPLDYTALTEDLFWFQFSDTRDSVRLRWGRDFYRRQENDGKENYIKRKDEN